MAENESTNGNAATSHFSKGFIPAKVIYPPKVAETGRIDHIYEATGTYYSRDIGRSSVIGGKVFYQFGDTFCHDDRGEAVIVSNTAAVVDDIRDPFSVRYPSYSSNGVVTPLLELSEEERIREQETAGEEYKARITLWHFSGIVETEPGKGLLWYEKRELYWDKALEEGKHCGIGIADVEVHADGYLKAYRRDGLVFGDDEPLIGNVSALLDGDFVYLFGNRGESDIILARVHKDRVGEKDEYKYWNGECYKEGWSDAVPILQGYQSAHVFRSNLFGADLPWVLVGVNRFCDSMIQIAAAPQLEGPWISHAVCQAPVLNTDKFPEGCICYCIYAHPWAYQDDSASLFITWSEQYPGEVVGAKLTFEVEPETWWGKLWLHSCHVAISDKTDAELNADEDFFRFAQGGRVRITEWKTLVPDQHAHSASVNHGKYLLFKGPDEKMVTQAARMYYKKLYENREAEETKEKVEGADEHSNTIPGSEIENEGQSGHSSIGGHEHYPA